MNDILLEHLIDEELDYVTGGDDYPDGSYLYCNRCRIDIPVSEILANNKCCPYCGHQFH